jgi:hypothetical protein
MGKKDIQVVTYRGKNGDTKTTVNQQQLDALRRAGALVRVEKVDRRPIGDR